MTMLVYTENGFLTFLYFTLLISAANLTLTEENNGGNNVDGALTTVDIEQPETEGERIDMEKASLTDEVFYPTDQWQTVKPGQAIPSGLHVRMNMETGVNEAKLKDEDIDKLRFWSKDGKQGMLNTQSKTFTHAEIKHALKQFKSESHTEKATEEDIEAIKKQYRSYESLREDLKRMDMDVRTDGEIITEYYTALTKDDLTVDQRVNILVNIEYYVHQIDNAVLFSDLGGMRVIHDALNGSHSQLRKEAAAVLAAAVQSNPKAQIKTIQEGILPLLLQLLSNEVSDKFTKTYLFAISSLIRHFPYAQQEFLRLGGLRIMSDIFRREINSGIRLKMVTLLHDLVVEKAWSEKLKNDTTHDIEKKKQYAAIPLVESLVEQGWCNLITLALDESNHDANEKTLHAMKDLKIHCYTNYGTVLPMLRRLHSLYSELAANEQLADPTDDYYSTILGYLDDILSTIFHDEL